MFHMNCRYRVTKEIHVMTISVWTQNRYSRRQNIIIISSFFLVAEPVYPLIPIFVAETIFIYHAFLTYTLSVWGMLQMAR
jgi:hypothetical protein